MGWAQEHRLRGRVLKKVGYFLWMVRERGREKRHILSGGKGNGESSHQVSDNFSKMGTKADYLWKSGGQEVGWQLEV